MGCGIIRATISLHGSVRECNGQGTDTGTLLPMTQAHPMPT